MRAFRGLLLVGLLSAPGLLSAQGIHDSVNVARRNDCRLAHQVLTTGQPQTHAKWALEQIGACPELAGEALAGRWAAAPADSVDLDHMVSSSTNVRDQRILDAVLGVAANTAQPDLLRLSALRVLVSYADRDAWVQLSDIYPTISGIALLPSRSDFAPADGTQPLRGDTRDRVVALVATLRTASPPAVANAAEYLHRGLTLRAR